MPGSPPTRFDTPQFLTAAPTPLPSPVSDFQRLPSLVQQRLVALKPRGLSERGLALVLVASFMVVLDFSIVNVALPSIRHSLGFGGDSVQWVVTAYAITFGGLLLLGGRMGDVLGRRRMFEIGLVLFAASSLAAGLAASASLLVISRAVQGIGGALIAPASLSLITSNIDEGPARSRALGLYGATASVGFVAGQVLGGVLVQFTSWRSIFLVNVPVGLVALLSSRRLLDRDNRRSAARRLDVTGGILSTIAAASLVFVLSEGTVLGWTRPVVIGAAALTIVAMVAFVGVERVHSSPLVRLSLFRRASLSSSGVISLFLGFWTAGELVVLSVYMQESLHDSPLVAGLVIAPQGIVGFITGMFGARLARRFGMRRLLLAATGSAALGFLFLSRLPASGGYSPTFLAVVLVGFGTVGTVFGTTVLAASNAERGDQGLVGGVVNTARQIGAAIGVALLAAIADGSHARTGISSVSGDRAAMMTAAGVAFAGTVAAWLGARSTTSVSLVAPILEVGDDSQERSPELSSTSPTTAA